ncbi:hypothetical protein [Umezawaea sp.]|uniref:hypothetical protein n=1 Tax=Umezawaea sp. TaxID=1955258 RepID=UPI002ED54E59
MRCHIAFLGIDGAGKSTLASALATRLRQEGERVRLVSLKDYLRADSDVPLLRTVYRSALQAAYAGARTPGGDPALPLVPADVEDPDEALGSIPVASNDPASILAAGLLGVSAELLLHQLVVAPALAGGEVLVQDGHGLKTAVKAALIAEAAGGDGTRFLGYATEVLPRPTLGVFVRGEPALASRRRLAQHGRFGFSEHLGLAGRPRATFTSFQHRAQQLYATVAADRGWLTVDMTDRPVEENVRAALSLIGEELA